MSELTQRRRRPQLLTCVLTAAIGLTVLLRAPGVAAADPATAAALHAGALPLFATEPDAADAQQLDTMLMTTSLPWGAIGFIDNGCTGTLIGPQHVLAAAHCFTFDGDVTANGTLQGAWQTGLVFFPNYHPARPNPPRYLIDRVVVGSRVQTDPGQPSVAADWGIGHLAAPVSGFPALPLSTMPRWQYPNFVTFAGYARNAAVFPQGQASFPQPAPGGYCANFFNNCWWIPALVDPKCLAKDEVDGGIVFDNFSCERIIGGNSGSPILWDGGNPSAPSFRITGVISGPGGNWSASRFEHAPRFAAGIAVASHDDGTKRTQIFATDSDLGRVVSRFRSNTSATGPFTYFRNLGAVPNAGSMAAFRRPNGRPQVVVIGGTGTLFSSHVGNSGQWQSWSQLPGPAGLTGFFDIAAVNGSASLPFWSTIGVPHLFAIGNDHALYTTRASSVARGVNWAPWVKLPLAVDVQRVTVVRHGDGRLQVFVVSTRGDVQTLSQNQATPAASWSASRTFSSTTVKGIVDVTAAWDRNGNVQVFAIDKAGDAWTRTATSKSPQGGWSAWASWSVPLYAPGAATPPKLDGIVSLTATRWLESVAVVRPAVFATDQQGNIYLTTYENGAWRPWRSFYN
jgi:hypothetical protein